MADMQETDGALLEKLEDAIQSGITTSKAIQFLAVLSISEYDRLIMLFNDNTHESLPGDTRRKLVQILEKLRAAKRGIIGT